MTTLCRLACLAVGCVAVLGATGASARVDLLSHRAVYRLSLADTERSIGVTSIDGGLVLEWRASCEGSISNQRIGFVAGLGDGPGFVYDVRFSSWESRDGTQLRFSVRSFDDGKLVEAYRGEAALDAADGGGQATFVSPEDQTLELPRGTLFPTEHMRRLIESAERGDVVIGHDLFDGSGLEGLSRVTAVIGRSEVAERPSPEDADQKGADQMGADATGTARIWPVSLAYHPEAGVDDMPSFEISFDLTERGVLHDLVLDYGDFALKAEMEQLETFPEPVCH